MKKEEKKIIPLKNYISVIILFVVTFTIVLGLRAWYRTYKEYNLTIPILSGKLQEITLNEFDDFITEHDDFFVYIGIVSNKDCRTVENSLINVLEKRNIKNNTIYLNMTNKSKEKLNNKLATYGYKENNINYPIFLIIRDKKIIEVVSTANIGNIEKLLDQYEIGD